MGKSRERELFSGIENHIDIAKTMKISLKEMIKISYKNHRKVT
jgi:hypothetical protein